MPTLCTVTATTSTGGNLVDVDARGGPGGTEYYLAEIEAEVDATVMEALRPRGRVQRVGVRLYKIGHDGDPVNPATGYPERRLDSYMVGGWRVTRSLGRMVQGASFSLGSNDDSLIAGSPMHKPTVHGKPGPWTIALCYRFGDDGEQEFPLITWGRMDSSERTVSAAGVVDNFQLHDDARYLIGDLSTVQLPAGHGLTYAQVVRKLWLAQLPFATEPLFGNTLPPIPKDFAFRKEVNLIQGDAAALIGAIGDLMGVHYFVDEQRRASGAVYAPEQVRGPIQGVIDERDILVAVNDNPETITVREMPDPPTRLCFSGTTQFVKTTFGTRDLQPGDKYYHPPQPTRQSLELPSTSFATFAPKAVPYVQDGAGVLTATGATESTRDGITSESLTVIDIDHETVVGVQSASKGWHNLSAARYTINADLDLTPIAGVYVEENTNGAQAKAWREERFIDLAFSTQSLEFDADNALRFELQEQWSIHHRRAAIQSRPDLNTSWEDTANAPGVNGLRVLGNGEGVTEARASLQLTERRLVEHTPTTDGYKAKQRTRIYAWNIADGWQYRYGNGATSSDSTETFRLVSDKEEWWLSVRGREDIHVYRWLEHGPGGKLLGGKDDTVQGAIPPATVRTDLVPRRESFDSDAEWRLAKAASLHDVQPMHFELYDEAAESVLGRYPIEQRATYELAQLPWQLENAARRIFIKGRARTVTFSVPPNPLFRIGQWWRVRYRRPGLDLDHDAIILDSHFEQRDGSGPIVQRLTVAVH